MCLLAGLCQYLEAHTNHFGRLFLLPGFHQDGATVPKPHVPSGTVCAATTLGHTVHTVQLLLEMDTDMLYGCGIEGRRGGRAVVTGRPRVAIPSIIITVYKVYHDVGSR